MIAICPRLWCAQAAITAVLSAILLLPSESRAQGNLAAEQGSPAREIESPQEDDGLDSNLVPLEPELTTSPPDLPSTDNTEQPEQTPNKDTPGTASADALGPMYNIPVVIDQAVQSHIRFFNIS
ncbi:MAG TPA: hypothetical protein VIT63_02215, partial [Nitrospira sp.]